MHQRKGCLLHQSICLGLCAVQALLYVHRLFTASMQGCACALPKQLIVLSPRGGGCTRTAKGAMLTAVAKLGPYRRAVYVQQGSARQQPPLALPFATSQ